MALSASSAAIYIIRLIQGKARPERITWLLWAILGAVYLVAAIRTGGNVVYTSAVFVGPVVVFFLSFKYGVGGKSTLDLVSLAVATVALILLLFTNHAIISLALCIFVDLIGALLTIRKLMIDPSSEPKITWLLSALGGGCALLGLQNYRVENLVFPVYIMILGLFTFMLVKPAPEGEQSDPAKLNAL